MSSVIGLVLLMLSVLTGRAQPMQPQAAPPPQLRHTVFLPAQPHDSCVHIVQPGDTLSAITPNWQEVAVANHIPDPNLIFPGQQINLCASSVSQASVATSAVVPAAPVAFTAGEPCASGDMWPAGAIVLWQIPTSCYAGVYPMGLSDCYSWVQHLFGGLGGRTAHDFPIPGAILHFAGGVQGASWQGHWAVAVAVRSPWILVSEANNYWRGGWGMVTYRYVLETGGITYFY